MRAKTARERSDAFLLEILDELSSKFSGKVRKRRVVDAFERFSYGAALLGRIPLAMAADEARAFVAASKAAGKGLVPLIAALRKEVTEGDRKLPKGAPPRKSITAAVKDVIRAADPAYVRMGPPRLRELGRRLRRADFRGRADSSTLMSVSVRFRGDDPSAAVALFTRIEGQGLVAVGNDPYRKKGAMAVLSGPEAIKKVLSSKVVATKKRHRLKSIRRRLSSAEMREVGLDAASGVRYPLALKFGFLVASLIVATLAASVFLTDYFLRASIRADLAESVRRNAAVLASRVTEDFRNIVAKAQPLLSIRDTPGFAGDFFSENPEILYAGVDGKFDYFNDAQVADWEATRALVENIRSAKAGLLEAGKNKPAVADISSFLGRPGLLIAVPYRDGAFEHAFAIAIDSAGLLGELRTGGPGVSCVADAGVSLVLRPEATDPSTEETLAALSLADLFGKGGDGGLLRYRGASGAEYSAAFSPIDFADLRAVSVASARRSLSVADDLLRRNLYLLGAMLILSILFAVGYSRSITRTIGLLVDACRKVARGEFLLDIEPATRDELGVLTATVREMGKGLSDRERSRNAFGKFVHKAIADRGLRDESSLRGRRRLAAVLVSRLHGIKSYSENREPEETVELINAYFASAAGCVEETGGFVDKITDASITAVWGLPFSAGRDAAAAVDAALRMRAAVEAENKKRRANGVPRIVAGCAIDVGMAFGGRVGAERRMEYTVFGDPVARSARLEALTAPFGVDILVSEAVRVDLGAVYRLAVMPRVKAGKARSQHVYAVLGREDDSAAPRTVAELRGRLGIEDRTAALKAAPPKPKKPPRK